MWKVESDKELGCLQKCGKRPYVGVYEEKSRYCGQEIIVVKIWQYDHNVYENRVKFWYLIIVSDLPVIKIYFIAEAALKFTTCITTCKCLYLAVFAVLFIEHYQCELSYQ